MKTTYVVILSVLLLLVSACAQKVNDPADVQAIKKSCEDYLKACNAKDANAVAALMTDNAVFADENVPIVVGKEAIQKYHQWTFDQSDFQFTFQVTDAQATGGLGAARGSFTVRFIPKATGLASSSVSGNWIAVLKRQGDGSWKWESAVANSDQPAPGSTASGEDEQALYQIERDWAAAAITKDTAVVEKFLANEYVTTFEGRTQNKKQYLAEMKASPAKIESNGNKDMRASVFGDTAFVQGVGFEKSTTNGKDTSGQWRYMEIYAKRDGRWQCLASVGTKE